MSKAALPVDLKKIIPIALAIATALALYAFRGAIFFDQRPLAPLASIALVYTHPLTGLPVEGATAPIALPQVYAVVVDNHPDAQPLYGIEEAFLVIEAPVEGGITRFLAFFYEGQEVNQVGPVRSARPYFVQWAEGWDALFAHVGGSPAALDMIASGGTFDLNQYWNGEKFWRVNGTRVAPHNVFTSIALLSKAREEAAARDRAPELLYEVWKFASRTSQTVDPLKQVSIGKNSGAVFEVGWEYDAQTQTYMRTQNGKPHIMGNGREVRADTVIVLETPVKILDAAGRREILTVGSGTAVIYTLGGLREVEWRKPSVSQGLRFFENGQEVLMMPGRTWIEVVPE